MPSPDRSLRTASVVVPAHQEQASIGRCLEALLSASLQLDVVVVANGCTDATVEVARRYPVRVLDLPTGSKPAALDAGDQAVSGFPRVYVDADVVLDGASLERLVAVLDVPAPRLATPRARYELPGASPIVRLYWRTWRRLKEVRGDHLGCGVYAVNAGGRARWASFPAGAADDYHVHTRFAPDERRQVAGAQSVVRPPRTLRSLLAVRTRVYAGMVVHDADRPALQRPARRLSPLLRDPLACAGVPVYLALTLIAKRRAVRANTEGAAAWARDDSGRAA